jgi:hypothetical protein
VATDEVNIWTDPAAAAYVRSLNAGNETGPTVVVAGEILVNPTVRQVQRALERDLP